MKKARPADKARSGQEVASQGDLFGGPPARPTEAREALSSAVPPPLIEAVRNVYPPSPDSAVTAPKPHPLSAASVALSLGGGAAASSAHPVRAARLDALATPSEGSTAARTGRAGPSVVTVGELTRQIKTTLERGFPRVSVRGEISGFRGANARGHLYFSLKDADACIDTKIWASLAARLKFKPRDGLAVVVEGSVDLYEPQGRYSLIVSRIEPEGEGALAIAFQKLKERLAEEGLLGDRRARAPRALPFLPRRIGVVTSITGAALRDFLRILHQRHPKLSVLVCDARVQGEGATREVVRGIERLSRTDVDVIVLTRGGGSIEDLWTFNEEAVARAIFACPVPVVSAIGHEIDFTISDFVADHRAPTPSAAAEKLAPVLRDLEHGIATAANRLRRAVERRVLERRHGLALLHGRLSDPRRALGQHRHRLSEGLELMVRALRKRHRQSRERQRGLFERLQRQHPRSRLVLHRDVLQKLRGRLEAGMREALRRHGAEAARLRLRFDRASPQDAIRLRGRRLTELSTQLRRLTERRVQKDAQRHQELIAKLEAMSPLKVLARGYSVTFRQEDGRLVRGANEVKVGDLLAIRLAPAGCVALAGCDEIDAQVTQVRQGTAEEFPREPDV